MILIFLFIIIAESEKLTNTRYAETSEIVSFDKLRIPPVLNDHPWEFDKQTPEKTQFCMRNYFPDKSFTACERVYLSEKYGNYCYVGFDFGCAYHQAQLWRVFDVQNIAEYYAQHCNEMVKKFEDDVCEYYPVVEGDFNCVVVRAAPCYSSSRRILWNKYLRKLTSWFGSWSSENVEEKQN